MEDNILIGWFEEGLKYGVSLFNLKESSVIYKGFKISRSPEGVYTIQDVRFTNMYSDVLKEDYAKFKEFGFIVGADMLSFDRDTDRVLIYKKKIELLYTKLRKFKAELPKNKRLNEKRIANIDRNVDELVSQMFYYKTKVNQYNLKYKLN